jgi:hypothetical protein
LFNVEPVPILIFPEDDAVVLAPVPIFRVPDVCDDAILTSVLTADAFNEGAITDVPVITPVEEIDPDAVAIDENISVPCATGYVKKYFDPDAIVNAVPLDDGNTEGSKIGMFSVGGVFTDILYN